jgi:hypothetical protein
MKSKKGKQSRRDIQDWVSEERRRRVLSLLSRFLKSTLVFSLPHL